MAHEYVRTKEEGSWQRQGNTSEGRRLRFALDKGRNYGVGGGGRGRTPQCGLQLITRTVGKARWGQDSHFFQPERETESPVLMVLQTGPKDCLAGEPEIRAPLECCQGPSVSYNAIQIHGLQNTKTSELMKKGPPWGGWAEFLIVLKPSRSI